MPAQTALTRATRSAMYLEVIRLMHTGETQKDACRHCEVSESAFIEWRDKDPESLIVFQDLLTETTRSHISDLIVSRTKVIKKLISDALSDDTKPGERLAIFMKMEGLLDKLSQDARLGVGSNEAADDVLGGPVFTPGTSRFAIEAAPGTEITIKTSLRKSPEDPPDRPDIIEGEFEAEPDATIDAEEDTPQPSGHTPLQPQLPFG